MFRRVRAQVLTSTGQQQRPHEYQSLLREHYLAGQPTAVTESTPPPAPDVTEDRADTPTQSIQQREAWQEVVFWESVRESEFPEDFEEFLRLWPEGLYAPLARSRLRRLRTAAAATSVATPAVGNARPSTVSSSVPASADSTQPNPLASDAAPPVSDAPPSPGPTDASPAGTNAGLADPVSMATPPASDVTPGTVPPTNVLDAPDLVEPQGPAGMQFAWIPPESFKWALWVLRRMKTRRR